MYQLFNKYSCGDSNDRTLTDITSSNTNWSSGSSNDNYGDGNDIGINGSWDYSYWSTSELLTGDCRHEVNGTTLSVTTNLVELQID